jgi:alpha-L-arabinofuranosidase
MQSKAPGPGPAPFLFFCAGGFCRLLFFMFQGRSILMSRRCAVWLFLVSCAADMAPGQTNFSIYSDQLNNNFQNWSWNGGHNNFANPSPVHSGSDSIAFTGGAWEAISFWHADFNPSPYTNLSFWICGGPSGGQMVRVYLEYTDYSTAAYQIPALAGGNIWRQVVLPLSTFGSITNLYRIDFQLTSNTTNSFYLDDISLFTVPPDLVHLKINTAQTLRPADSRWLGLNTAVWDSSFDTPETASALGEIGTRILRFPGGSLSDEYHWATGRSGTNTWTWGTVFSNFIHIATNTGAQAMITVNYGTGTSNEAAAWVRSANVTNHLGFKYWEIGNECYGTWETDTNNLPHDPYTYAVRARDYIAAMKAADNSIHIGLVAAPGENSYSNNAAHFAVNPRTGATNYGWTPVMLSTLRTLGATPDFLIHHVYPEWTDKNNPAATSDNDVNLLNSTINWSADASDLRQQISDYLGPPGTNVELVCTENNSDSGAQGKQSTSLVNGLYLAESLAELMKTEFNGFFWWDLRNGTDYNGYFGPNVYGWRTFGDLGIINGLNTKLPVFYTDKLMQFFARSGDTVLNPVSDYFKLPVYATRKADGSLAMLIINKDNAAACTAQLSLTNYLPWTNALVRQFGIAQDEATRTNSTVPGAQDIGTNYLSIAGTNFNATFPPYSVTLLTLPPAAPTLVGLPATNGLFNLQVGGQTGVRYVLQSRTNLTTGAWISAVTNTLTNATWNVSTNFASPAKFWRVVWLPLNY